MATTVALRKMLDLKRWEMCNPLPFTGTPNFAGVQSTVGDGLQFWINTSGSYSNLYMYSTTEDAWLGTPLAHLPGALVYHPNGPTGTASAATATTLTTTVTAAQTLAGYTIRITGGTGAGQERTITASTTGANAVVTVAAWSSTPDATSTYLILSGRVWLMNTSASATLRYYDVATNTTSSALSVSGFTGATYPWALAATPAYGSTLATGTATSATSTTLTNSGKAWTASQWINSQVRITGGTGAGQVRTITASTSTALTVAAWSTTPDATSTYVIEPNDDFIYATGNSNVTLYRYSISGNSWSTLSPAAARTTAFALGAANLVWIGATSDATWADETVIKNGRYLFSVSSSGAFNFYDIAANTWINLGATYRGAAGSAMTTASFYYIIQTGFGVSVMADREYVYLTGTGNMAANSVTPIWRYNVVTGVLESFTMLPYSQSTNQNAQSNAQMVISSYVDGGTTLRWLYYLVSVQSAAYPAGSSLFGPNNSHEMFLRMLII